MKSEHRELICLSCPMGCNLSVDIEEDRNLKITGNQCKRGESYAKTEVINPTRTLTTTIKINNGFLKRLPVRTVEGIPKNKIFDAMKIINKVVVDAPIKVGEVIIKDILGTGVDVVASRSMKTDNY